MKPNAKGFDANASVCLRDVKRGEGGRIPEDRTNAGSRPRPPIISSHVRALLRALSLYLCLPPYCPKERAVTAAAAATVETAVKRDRIAPLSPSFGLLSLLSLALCSGRAGRAEWT